jgi:hypothetical protein
LKRTVVNAVLVAVLASTTIAVGATPAAASYPCPGGYGCFWDYGWYTGGPRWLAPTCGDFDLRNYGWQDRISGVANQSGAKADLYNEWWLGWEFVDTVNGGTTGRSYSGSWRNNITDRIIVAC